MKPKTLSLIASVSLLALIALCLAWEGILAPLRPGGSWMTLKVLPLMVPLFGILRGKRYTYQWSTMLILLYLTEGVVRTNDAAPGNALALAEAVLSVVFFLAAMLYARNTAPSRLAQASPRDS
ncbi:MAG TPA: DUF2069 domain-containing protein [Zoogloea sp.]|jgi:uncharacterized membrane protein|uniref:DUF2069 domain-containing protein n=1 Tax=Zoogloea sp. TaxID=49181 RepID=UPI002C7E86F6|nr:DUF2069 domain-containing protein [Zoogloea sp.]HOB45850.1 DUF2069 domain-containing protein [Zoogloea sp.]HQA10817.1 DUF2069 domain-containing protein [Zoogloea sp.]HQE38511.1 DUF2069 domain-containing protein [Zoogloea sp.]